MKFKDLKEELFKGKRLLIKKGDLLEKKEETINKRLREIDEMESNVQELCQKRREELEKVANLSSEEARRNITS